MNDGEIADLKTRINTKNKEFELLQKKNLLIEEEAIQLAKEISVLQKLAQETKFLQEMEIRLSSKEEELKKTLKIFEQEINEKIERYTIEYANKMLQDLELKQKMLKEQEEKIKELQRNIASINETKVFLETQFKEKQSTLPAKNIEELNEKINELLVKKVENTKLFEKAQKETKEFGAKLSNLTAAIEVNETKSKELEESLKQLKVHAVCPICETGLNETKKKELLSNKELVKNKLFEENKICKNMLSEEKQKLEGNEKQCSELTSTISLLEKQRIELNEKKSSFTELSMLSQKIDSTSKEIEAKQTIYSIALKGFSQEAEKELIQEQKRFEKVIQAIAKKEELNMLLKQSVEVTEKLKSLNFNEDYFEKLKAMSSKKDSEKESNLRELLSMTELIQQMNKSIEAFEALKEQKKKIEEETISLKALQEKMMIFINSLKASQSELRELLIDTVNQAMDDIWPRIYPYKDFVSAKIEIEENGDYELKVKQNSGKWVRVEGILSGGERSSAAICIRIAFSLVLTQNLSWLILDEPTHNLDEKSVRVLSKMMKEHLPELVEQIFIITHDTEMEKAASGSLYLLERDKELQGATNAVLMKN
ncbi:MAG: hypothetical protein Q7S21_00955 [archaeon]|nr:hypothetical protein [archaeon]